MRCSLVAALVACADSSLRPEVRRFLLGLSADELQFIADFLGACILEAPAGPHRICPQLANRMTEFQQVQRACSGRYSEDHDHKLILLREYLCRGGVAQSAAARAGGL